MNNLSPSDSSRAYEQMLALAAAEAALAQGAALAEAELSEATLTEAAVHDDESMKDAIKKILPKNDTTNVFGTIEWRKKGGTAGAKTLDTIKTKLMAIGFKKEKVGSKSTPTGSAVGFNATLVHPLGWKASLKQHYGSQPIYIASIEKEQKK